MLVERYNFRKEKEIKKLAAMKMLHNDNFKDIIDANQINVGYLMFTHTNRELCEKCHRYEQMIIDSFGQVLWESN